MYEFLYETIEEYEQLVGFKVNEAFRIGWDMARAPKSLLSSFKQNSESEKENE